MPPMLGMSSATAMASTPKPSVEMRATFISVVSPAAGRRRLKISLVKTPAEMFSVAFSELAVAKIMPPSMSPSMPAGIVCLHFSR